MAIALRWREWLDDAEDWAQGRSWLWRAPLVLYLAIAGWRHLRSEEYSSFLFGGVTFGIHELGHVVFHPFGEFMGFAGGSIAQILAPIAAALTLLYWQKDGDPQRDYFGAAVAIAWLSFSLWNLATYVGDARDQFLPLLGLSAEPQHDWHYLLGRLGLLESDATLASILRLAALALWLLSLAFSGWLLKKMAEE